MSAYAAYTFERPGMLMTAAVSREGVAVRYNGHRETWTRSFFAAHLAIVRTSKAYSFEVCRDPYLTENFSLEA